MTDHPTAPADERYIVGPDEFLVLVCRRDLTMADADEIIQRVPEVMRGRVLVVDGTQFDAYKLAAAAGPYPSSALPSDGA